MLVISVCETGPIVAYLNRNDPHHDWAAAVMQQVRPPLLTCEAVLTEAVYFLRDDGLDVDPVFRMLERAAAATLRAATRGLALMEDRLSR